MRYHIETDAGDRLVNFKPTEDLAAAKAHADHLREEVLKSYAANSIKARAPHYHVIATDTVYVTSTLEDIVGLTA